MNWPELLRIPDAGIDPSFAAVAERLLNGTELRVAGQSYRLLEIEFYLFHAAHTDPFSHRDPLQLHCGHWYLHRTHGGLRSGSFKGLDLTYGNGTASGGVLVRSLARADGTVIDGPSLCVDHLLAALRFRTVADLDRALAGRLAWDADNPLSLQQVGPASPRELLRTARVGLTLRAGNHFDDKTRFLMRPYRFLSEPRRVAKGKRHMVLALHAQGADVETIRAVTGSRLTSIRRCIDDFEAGRKEEDFTPYAGLELGPREWCRLYGLWHRVYGNAY
jgi:hypothetical protein